MRQRTKSGVWLLLVLTLLVLSGLVMISRPTYADDSVRFKPRLDHVDEPKLPPATQERPGTPADGRFDGPKTESPSPWSWAWKIGLFTALAGAGLPMTSLLRREFKKPNIDWTKVKDFSWGVSKGIGVAAGAILVVGGLALLAVVAGIPAATVTTALFVLAAVFVTVGAGFSIWQRWKEQQAAGIDPSGWKTVGVGVLDALGISGLIEGAMGRRLLTGESLDPEVAGEAFGTGLVQVAALGVGARTLPKGLGRVSAASSESILSRLGRTLGAWWKVRKTPEASLPGVWRLLGAVGEGTPYVEVISKLPPPLQALLERLIGARMLTLGDDGILRGPAGKVALPKVKEALTANNVRRLRNIFNNVKGGEAQLRAEKAIEAEDNYSRFVAKFRNPSAGGLDAIVEMKDGTFHIVEVKGQESAVGPNDVYKVLKYTPGKDGEPGTAEIDVENLLKEIMKRVKDPIDQARLQAAVKRGDGSVVLRVELVGTQPTAPLYQLNGRVINGIKIMVNPPLP